MKKYRCQACHGSGTETDYPAGYVVGARHQECEICRGEGEVSGKMLSVRLNIMKGLNNKPR